MSCYRAALASARAGDLTGAARLARCSVALAEDAPGAVRLLELLRQQNTIDGAALTRLRTLTNARQYGRASWIKLPQTSKAHTIRGLLYAQLGLMGSARKEFALALALDTGNDLAKRALQEVSP